MKRIDSLFSRKAARIAAEDRILDVAALKPASVAGALLQYPEAFRELSEDLAKTLLLSLIDRGQSEVLHKLLGHRAIGRRKSTLLAELLLADAFAE